MAKKATTDKLTGSGAYGRRDEDLLEKGVITAARRGNEKACEYLVEKYRGLVRRNIGPYYLKGADREDLVQEGMIGLLNAIRDYNPARHSSFYSFANLCIRRQILTAIKGANRQKHIPLNSSRSIYSSPEDDDLMPSGVVIAADDENNPEVRVLVAETLDILRNRLPVMLSSLEKRVLDAYIVGKTYHEIAREIDRTEKSVDNALTRIRSKALKFFY